MIPNILTVTHDDHTHTHVMEESLQDIYKVFNVETAQVSARCRCGSAGSSWLVPTALRCSAPRCSCRRLRLRGCSERCGVCAGLRCGRSSFRRCRRCRDAHLCESARDAEDPRSPRNTSLHTHTSASIRDRPPYTELYMK